MSVGVFFFVLRLLKTEERRSRRIIARGDETNHRQAASLDSSTAATDKITAAEERFTLSSTSPFSPIDDTFLKYLLKSSTQNVVIIWGKLMKVYFDKIIMKGQNVVIIWGKKYQNVELMSH